MAQETDTRFILPKLFLKRGVTELIIVILAVMLYSNTLMHDFTQDDAIVIYNNIYVQQGIDGIEEIFSKDSFSGFFGGEDKSGLVSGGRYRPFSIAIFACVYEVVGPNQFYYHLLAVLMFALVCLVLYKVIMLAGSFWPKQKRQIFGCIAVMLFLVHPIHTEVVANVKGLDETFSLLFGLLATLCAITAVLRESKMYLLLMAILFFIAVLSKENGVAFLLIIPTILYGFIKTKKSLPPYIVPGIILVITFCVYWILRDSIIGSDLSTTQLEMMNNPFIKIVDNRYVPFSADEKWASIIYGMGKYIQLLFFPHPLTHDYYPRQFGIVSFRDISVIMAFAMNAFVILIALLGVKKRSFISFCILTFYVTIGLMSNVLFPIGTHLSERFLFTPSIAICLLMAYLYVRLRERNHLQSIMPILLGSIMFLACGKTVMRNQTWKDDFTLFTTDVKVSKNSAKVRNAAGGALLDRSFHEEGEEKKSMIHEAIGHLSRAIEIHPNYKEAYLLLGNGYLYQKEYDRSISAYTNALKINPYYDEASSNLLIALREGAKQAGGKDRDFPRAINYLEKALEINANDFESTALMGTAYGSSGNHNKAIEYYNKAIVLKPDIATTYVNLGLAQLNAGSESDAQMSFNKAVQLDPKALDNIRKRN